MSQPPHGEQDHQPVPPPPAPGQGFALPEAPAPAAPPSPYGPPSSGGAEYGGPGYGGPVYGGPVYGGPVYGGPEHPAPYAPPMWNVPRPVSGLGVAVIGVSAVYLAVDWARAVTAFAAQSELEAGGTGRAAALYLASSGLLTVFLVAAWVVTSVWLMRAYNTAFAAAPTAMRRSVAWTWLGWWVPFVSLWFPRQIVDDVWKVAAGWPGRSAPRPTGAWWTSWLFFVISGRLIGPASTSDGVASFAPGWHVFSALLGTVSFVLWVRVVRGLSAAHDGTESSTTGVPGPAAPA